MAARSRVLLVTLLALGCGGTKALNPDGGDAGAERATSSHDSGDDSRDDAVSAGDSGAETRDADAAGDARVESGGPCSFTATYTFYDDGGLTLFVDVMQLSPPGTETLDRRFTMSDDGASCARALACDSSSEVTVPEIEAAVANADVQAALAQPKGTLYGTDPRPADGTVWVFERNDDEGFMVGDGAVPAGLTALETLMQRVSADLFASPECHALTP
jgi:hypothetical protein